MFQLDGKRSGEVKDVLGTLEDIYNAGTPEEVADLVVSIYTAGMERGIELTTIRRSSKPMLRTEYWRESVQRAVLSEYTDDVG